MNSLKQEKRSVTNHESMYVQDDVRSTFCTWWVIMRVSVIIEVRSGKDPWGRKYGGP